MGLKDETRDEKTARVMIDADGGEVFEIDLDKNYVVILTLPADTLSPAGNETCARLSRMLTNWVEGGYPDKFLVIGLRVGANIILEACKFRDGPHPQAASIRGLGE